MVDGSRTHVLPQELDPTSDKVYYFNRITKESVWERPADFVKVIGDWEERANEEGQLYYYNRTRGESVWEKPAGFGRVTAAVVRLPRLPSLVCAWPFLASR